MLGITDTRGPSLGPDRTVIHVVSFYNLFMVCHFIHVVSFYTCCVRPSVSRTGPDCYTCVSVRPSLGPDRCLTICLSVLKCSHCLVYSSKPFFAVHVLHAYPSSSSRLLEALGCFCDSCHCTRQVQKPVLRLKCNAQKIEKGSLGCAGTA